MEAERAALVTTFVRWLRNGHVTADRLEHALDLPSFKGVHDGLKAAWAEILGAALQSMELADAEENG